MSKKVAVKSSEEDINMVEHEAEVETVDLDVEDTEVGTPDSGRTKADRRKKSAKIGKCRVEELKVTNKVDNKKSNKLEKSAGYLRDGHLAKFINKVPKETGESLRDKKLKQKELYDAD